MLGKKLALSDEAEIRSFLAGQGLPNGSTFRVLEDSDALLVIVPKGDAIKASWSPRKYDAVRQEFSDRFKMDIHILDVSSKPQEETRRDFEAGLRGYINHRFEHIIEDCHISATSPTRYDVFLEPEVSDSREIPRITRIAVKYIVNEFLDFFGLELARVHWTKSVKDVPTRITLLAAVKSEAPADLGSIARALEERGYPSVDEGWLRRKFDLLRKLGLVVRSREGRYALTEQALAQIPVRATRASSDVTRALALGRKDWAN